MVEYYGDKNAETVLVAMGSVIGTMKDAVDEMNENGGKIGILKVVALRPFPDEEIAIALSKAKNIAVLDKSISLGTEGILATEMRRAIGSDKKIVSYIVGLGGRDITKDTVKGISDGVASEKEKVVFIGK